jgi:hypothetical protein
MLDTHVAQQCRRCSLPAVAKILAFAARAIAIAGRHTPPIAEQIYRYACPRIMRHRQRRATVYCVAMSKSRRTAAKGGAGSSSFRPAAAQIDQLNAATRAKSSLFMPRQSLATSKRFSSRCPDGAGPAWRRTILW